MRRKEHLNLFWAKLTGQKYKVQLHTIDYVGGAKWVVILCDWSI